MPCRIAVALTAVSFGLLGAALPAAPPPASSPAASSPAALRPIALPATAPASRPTAPASRPTSLAIRPSAPATGPAADLQVRAKRVADLTRAAIQFATDNKLADAERALVEALALDPGNPTNLYNYACVLALTDRPDAAVTCLERTAECGWSDFTHLERDADLKSLRDLPRYQALLARKDEYRQRAAERALAGLKKHFGDGYLYELDADRKLIFATNVDAPTLDALKKWLVAQSASQWADLFAHRPDEFIGVVVPSAADYRKIVKVPGVGGFYNDAGKVLIAQRLGQTITHEFTHALHAADRAPLGQDHPIWVAEGLASMYEAAQFEGDKLVPRDNFRLSYLQGAAKVRRLIPLDQLVTMKQSDFVARANLAYGAASSVMLYLYEQNLLRPFYEAYKGTYGVDPTGRKALEQVTQTPLAAFEKAWVAWMVARPPVPTDTGQDGVVMGLRFGDATDGLRVDNVVPGGPAFKAGVKAGDVVFGLGDAELRDPQSFFPTLVRFKPGESVVLKVRRGGQYLDLPVTLVKRSEATGRAKREELLVPEVTPPRSFRR
jgi:hypothetical protein